MPQGSNLPSVMSHAFSRIPGPEIQRSVFDRTHGHKTTFDEGYIVPFFVDEVLPGDTLNLQATLFARLATPQFPIMDNVFLDTFFFYVPNRILWDNWEKFQGAQEDPGDSVDYEVPWCDGGEGAPWTIGSQSLGDHFGLPVGVAIPMDQGPCALPFRAYNLIWNEWFRDQNLQDDATIITGDGPDNGDQYVLLKRGKRHDYFTSCLPWPQKGDAVSLPLGTTAPVIGAGTVGIGFRNGTGLFGIGSNAGTNNIVLAGGLYGDNVGDAVTGTGAPTTSQVLGLSTDPTKTGMVADLASATAATVNQLREAFAFQEILERDARSGTRYTEILKGHFGVTVPDFRLQRPEYLGGSSQRVEVNGVPQTSSTDAETPQGNLAAYAQVVNRAGFNKSFVEHGVILGLMNVRADLTYQQGMDRMWSRRTRFDFYMPALAHLGEQAVLNKEIFMGAVGATNNGVFGYQERWAEYRYKPSHVTGIFRSDAASTLDAWHLAIDFSALPVLNDSFIQDDPPLERVIAVPSQPHILLDSYIKMRHVRPLPMYSVPGLGRL